MPKIKGHIRRSQLVTTYGVGSIIPIGDEAFMVAGLDHWDVGRPDLHEPRLARELRVEGFVQPPASDEDPDVPVVRFPTWQSCPICRRLARHKDFTHFDLNHCADCSQPLVPSRFVVACENGHIDDFPYDRWVHHGPPPAGQTHNLKLESTGHAASLAGITISCSCGAQRTMEDAFDRFALRDVTSCRGRRPWEVFEGESCDTLPRTLQRGASSVWFAQTRSALSIPPWSESASRALDGHWPTLRHVPTEAVGPIIASLRLDEKTGFTQDELIAIVAARKKAENGEASGETNLRREEYEALSRGRAESPKDVDFATRPGEVPAALEPWLEQLQLVTRLREVRALAGFSRILPPRGTGGDAGSNLVQLRRDDFGWLPAIEVKGEGLFIRLAEKHLVAWSSRHEVQTRVALLAGRDVRRHEGWGIAPQREITPVFLLLHVLAHAIINQLALEAGYPAGSLRERLFYEGDARGLLIYTATTDAAGSLGGLISQGEADRFEGLVREAVNRFSWCSADPVCIESEASGADSLNLAACHSCALLPETSCEETNSFLDRALLVGTPDAPDLGYFAGL
jgi:hypothetical protein